MTPCKDCGKPHKGDCSGSSGGGMQKLASKAAMKIQMMKIKKKG